MPFRTLEGEAARALGQKEKWELFSPFLKAHGREALSYATLQSGMEYFLDDCGYIAYTTVHHPVFAPRPKKIAFSDPVCAVADYPKLIRNFLSVNPRSMFAVVSEPCAEVLRSLKFKVNCIGYEPELPIQSYNTRGNWKELDMVKRSRNEAKREGIVIKEWRAEQVNLGELAAISDKWRSAKILNDREIWIYARRPVYGPEEDVRKFLAYDKEGHIAGFVFYDPMYRAGKVVGYSANISRCDEQRFGRLATAINMEAMEVFRGEGKEILNLCLAPFVKLEGGKYNDDWGSRVFFKLSAKYGNAIYNFQGLAFHKSKYRGTEKFLYYASNSLLPSNDIYLAFNSADISTSYFATVGQLIWGMIAALRQGKPA